jgi:hypothetical protein
MPGDRRWNALLEHSRAALACVRDEMQSYYQDRTHTWQESERGESLPSRIEQLDDILSELDELQS